MIINTFISFFLFSGSWLKGDSLSYHNEMRFTTHDADHDIRSGNCASESRHGAWWYRSCAYANLNGRYYDRSESATSHKDGIDWFFWKNSYAPLPKSEMKIRPIV